MFVGLVLGLALLCATYTTSAYTSDWESIDSRPLPSWYDEAKFGIFIHWGLYAVPSYGCTEFGGASGEWYWYELDTEKEPCLVSWHRNTYGDDFTYEDFANQWKTSMFDPDDWADIFAGSGAKYVVMTSKHHEGFCNWKSAQSWNWNSVDCEPHQDNMAMVSKAVKRAGLRMGYYHSLYEWYNPLYLEDKEVNGNTTYYIDEVLVPQMHDVVNNYQPDIWWSDGDWEMYDSYWRSTDFLAWLYNDSPVKDTVVVNDRWGINDSCEHGGFYTCSDRYDPGVLQPHKWENCLTLDKQSWGYRRNMKLEDVMTIEELLGHLASTVACNGNLLLNVGPTSEGMIVPIFEERLSQIGEWLEVNSESIFGSSPWRAQNDTAASVWYTTQLSTGYVYAIFLSWPASNTIVLTEPIPTEDVTTVELIGWGTLDWQPSGGSMSVTLPTLTESQLPSKYAWVLKIANVK
ncbi:alpha-l-fucosidase family protein [Pelomyxa schiedti]|nr:alpha-l-fucosidase family protein [Pelomyxa schiedti]